MTLYSREFLGSNRILIKDHVIHQKMRLSFCFLFFIFIFAAPFFNGSAANESYSSLGSLVIDPDACRAVLSASSELKGGDAAYVPGVDAYGRPVVPADGGGPGASEWSDLLLEGVRVDLTIDLARHLGMGSGVGSESWFNFWSGEPSAVEHFGAKAFVAEVTLSKGKIWINGKPLPSTSHSRLEAICRAKSLGE